MTSMHLQRILLLSITLAYGTFSLAASDIANKKVRDGDTVYGILRRSGFDDQERNSVLAQNPIPKNFVLAPGDIYQVSKSSANLTQITFFDRFRNLAYSFWKNKDKVGTEQKLNPLRTETGTISGKIHGSVVGSIRRLVGDEMLAYRFMDAFLLDVNMRRDIQKGADFFIKYEKLFSGEKLIRLGEVLEAHLEVGDKTLVRKFEPTDKGGVFLALHDNHEDRPLFAPVDYIRISSLFQARRFHPIKKHRRAHLGIDFELPEGENVYAVQRGTVLRFGQTRGAGRYVVLRHSNGLESYYNHMSWLSPNLRKGQILLPGAVIGRIGCTGYCTKPHLHFALKKNGRFVNPISYLKRYAYTQKNLGKQFARR